MCTKAKFYFTGISDPWYLIIIPGMNKIHPAIMEECARMDIQTAKWTDRLDTFLFSPMHTIQSMYYFVII